MLLSATLSLVMAPGCGTADLPAQLPTLANPPAAGSGDAKPSEETSQAALGTGSENPGTPATASHQPAASATPATNVGDVPASDNGARATHKIIGFRKSTVVLYDDEAGNNGARVPVSALSVPIKIQRVAASNGRFLISTVEGPRWVSASEVVNSAQAN